MKNLPLHYAIARHHDQIVELLLGYMPEAQVMVQNFAGNLPLHLACSEGTEFSVRAMLQHFRGLERLTQNGSDINSCFLARDLDLH